MRYRGPSHYQAGKIPMFKWVIATTIPSNRAVLIQCVWADQSRNGHGQTKVPMGSCNWGSGLRL
jgi:hypothetical protein